MKWTRMQAAKVLSKLNIQRTGNIQQNGPTYQQGSETAVPVQGVFVEEYEREISSRAYSPYDAKRYAKANEQMVPNVIEDGFSYEDPMGEQNECFEVAKPVDQMAISTYRYSKRELELENDLNSAADCEIRWEDLIFKEEIGHGKDVIIRWWRNRQLGRVG